MSGANVSVYVFMPKEEILSIYIESRAIIIIISGFGIYGAAVVPDSGVGNTWQRLTLILHEFLSTGMC